MEERVNDVSFVHLPASGEPNGVIVVPQSKPRSDSVHWNLPIAHSAAAIKPNTVDSTTNGTQALTYSVTGTRTDILSHPRILTDSRNHRHTHSPLSHALNHTKALMLANRQALMRS